MRRVGEESSKTYEKKLASGFFEKYMSGVGLEPGFKGYIPGVVPILETAIGVDLDYPGYDGKTLPFSDASQDYVYSSHTLEHIDNYRTVLSDWMRVLKVGGHLVIAVPHQFLYEKRASLPSKFNGDHRRYYSPASLLKEIEESLSPNTYRVKFLEDGDEGYDYSISPGKHCAGQCEITVVLQKITPPTWKIE